MGLDIIGLPDGLFVLLFFGFWVVAVIAFFFFSRRQRVLRKLKKHPDHAINSINNNEYVKVVGKALHVNELIKAPISGRPCILYHVIVRQKRNKGSSKILDVVSSGEFFVERQGDAAIVKVSGDRSKEEIYLKREVERRSGWLNDATPEMEALLEKYGNSTTNWLGMNKTLFYEEGIISSGERIAVLGNAQWKGLSEPIEGYAYSKILTLGGKTEQKLTITDLEQAVQLKNNLIERS